MENIPMDGGQGQCKNDCLYVFAPYAGKRWDIGA